jgi:acetoin utilization deacetylase AcuC-like enzyme
MSRLALIRDAKCILHRPPTSHPESPQRLEAIDQAFAASDLVDRVSQQASRQAKHEELALVHSESHLETIQQKAAGFQAKETRQLDPDTFMSEGSYTAAKLAAGAGIVAIDGLVAGRFEHAFVSVRPPGHHALRSNSMGFCLFNNVAVAAQYARKHCDFKRIVVIDWDVHHGNGTQEIFYDDPSVLFISLHEYPAWPGTGWFTEHGRGEGVGYNLNIPLPAGSGDRGHLAAWDRLVKPVCVEYAPELILVSAGYDAHQDDPLAHQNVSTAGFAMLSQRLADLSSMTGAGTICFLEGGYNTSALAASALATMRVMSAQSMAEIAQVHVSYLMPAAAMGSNAVTDDQFPSEVDERITDIRRHFGNFWRCLRS